MKELLTEVFLVKFAAALGVGPQWVPLYGYDLVMNKSEAEFVMELCLTDSHEIR